MKYITIDGDDVGQKISSCYFNNNADALSKLNRLIENKVGRIAEFLRQEGFDIIFCAADGVAACTRSALTNDSHIYEEIKNVAGKELTFSAGVGETLREAYVALLSAKSNGKARLCRFQDMI